MNNNKETLIKSNEKLMTEASTLLTNISNLETKIKDNTKVLDNANNIVTNFNTESKNVLENIRDKYRENFWKNLLKVGGISFILNGVIIGFFLWVTNLNYNKKLIVRESQIYEKLMQIDRVQRGEAKFYFDKKDNALYIQDAEKRNVPKKLEDETTYLIGFWQTIWNNLFK
ncbi:MAG: hypothetical protein ACRCU8_04190 [Cetobacterium sp.]